MTHISALYCYPIKSCAGHALEAAVMTPRGIKHDREFMIVDENGDFLTQREYPTMALVRPEVTDTTLTLNAPDMPTLSIDIQKTGTPHSVVVWRSTCDAIDQGNEVAIWLSTYFKTPCRLVRMGEQFVRHVNQDFAKRPDDQVSFADGYPFLLISEASLADLNKRLSTPLPMNRFRPNIVVTECLPFAEDYWEQIKLGDVGFDVVKACARCTITTVDQSTAETGKEPLKTLATYRNNPDKGVLFGQNLLQHRNGTLSVGDKVTIIRQ
ncbi:MAG: MOSC N-terminal beta barrel domain-containing protein [Chloroflexota bacterium]